MSNQLPAILIDYNKKRYLIPILLLVDIPAIVAVTIRVAQRTKEEKEAKFLEWCAKQDDLDIAIGKLLDNYTIATNHLLKSCLYEN